jgi:hypothetical protein
MRQIVYSKLADAWALYVCFCVSEETKALFGTFPIYYLSRHKLHQFMTRQKAEHIDPSFQRKITVKILIQSAIK